MLITDSGRPDNRKQSGYIFYLFVNEWTTITSPSRFDRVGGGELLQHQKISSTFCQVCIGANSSMTAKVGGRDGDM